MLPIADTKAYTPLTFDILQKLEFLFQFHRQLQRQSTLQYRYPK